MPTIDGTTELTIPAGTQNSDVLRLRARGVVDPRRGNRGDQLVHVKTVAPTRLTEKQRQLLQEFDQEEKAKQQKKGWF